MKVKSRLFLDIAIEVGQNFELPSEASHHIATVLRAKIGDIIGIFNGVNGEYAAEIKACKKKSVLVYIVAKIREHLPPEDITLFFAPLKKSPMEYLIQKGTELGCGFFQPIITERTIVRDINLERLNRIATEAAEQCHLTALPQIKPAISLLSVLEAQRPFLFCDEYGGGEPILRILKNHSVDSILIGPEGGFTQTEHDMIKSHQACHAVSLGPRIMRAETAAISALSATVLAKDIF
ncbi:MAG: 16S rRNA (uracil(1498)-N(3))-methyltransferase [Pseudomonadota bacterium]